MCRKDIKAEYEAMNQELIHACIQLFQTGDHPAIVTNAQEAAEAIANFLFLMNAQKPVIAKERPLAFAI